MSERGYILLIAICCATFIVSEVVSCARIQVENSRPAPAGSASK